MTAGGMLAAFTPSPASAQQAFPGPAAFSAYATGSQEHVTGLQSAPNRLANVDTSFAGASANSQTLKDCINNDSHNVVSPSLPDKNSYGRGAAAEVGLATDITKCPDQNQIVLSKLVEAAAPPSVSKVATDQLLEIPGDPLVYAKAAYEHATANWNNNSCVIGQPLSYGDNSLATAEVLNTSQTGPKLGAVGSQPLLATNTTVDPRQVNFVKSYTYLFPAGDGTFGVGSVTHMTVAPVTIGKGTANETTIEVLGTWTLRAETTGKGSTVSWNPEGNGADLVLRLLDANGNVLGNGQAKLTLNDILGKNGVTIPPNPLVQGSIAAPEHAIGDDTKPATKTATEASAAADILKLQLIQPDPNTQGVDIRIGHLETRAIAPAGGLECPIPVSKTANPDPVTAGNDFTWTITVPSAPDPEIACDLVNVRIDDVATVLSGSPSATITGASNGGVVGANTVSKGKSATVTWTNLGPIKPGSTLPVTISGHVPANSGAGVLQNTATVHASLANCTGGVAGQDFVSNATVNGRATAVNGAAVLGSATVQGPSVKAAAVQPARLAETGQKQPWLPVVGGGLLLGSLALMRSRRRLLEVRHKA